MSLIHRHHHHHNEFFERHMREFDRHVQEIQRDFEQHFPRSWLNRDLWLRPRFDFDSHFGDIERSFAEHRREMRRHFDEMERHFSEIVRKHGFEIDHIGNREDVLPKIVDGPNGAKSLALDISLPKNVDPSKINVSVKDGDLIIQADDKVEKENEKSQMHYYRRSTLPPGADVEKIKADLVNGSRLSITAPINPKSADRERSIQINRA
jgi:HSP20 family molecular chaperone IbpA